MNVSQALKIWLEYHRAHSKHNTIRAYQFTLAKFNQHFSNQTSTRCNFDCDFKNPCDSPMLRKLFRPKANVPLEIISKIILRHSSLQTTEIYIGKVSDTEAIRWIKNLYA